MKRKSKKILSFLIVIVMCAGFLPGNVRAEAEPDYQYGTMEYFSTISKSYKADSYYYSDEWFFSDPAERNDQLALISARVAASVAGDEQLSTVFLKKLGFETEANRFDSEENDCAYIIGTKTIQNGSESRSLTAVAFQGTGYGNKGWQQNVTVNGADSSLQEHASYASCVEAFEEDVEKLHLSSDDILWITGQSRGGAVANLAAASLLNEEEHPVIICRTFETPAVTEDQEAGSEKYNSIQNYITDDDPVTMLPIWGMKRYGQDILYNTASLGEVTGELKKMNADAAEIAGGYNPESFGGSVAGYLSILTAKLAAVVPERSDYSAPNGDSFTTDGETATITYTYQAGLQALCHVVFGGGTSGLTDKLTPLMGELPAISYSFLENAYCDAKNPENAADLRSDAVQKLWNTADVLNTVLTPEGAEPAWKQEDLYALEKLLFSLFTTTEQVSQEGWTLPEYNDTFKESDYINYLNVDNIAALLAERQTLVFSHHSDVIIARLKLLAPEPVMNPVDLTAGNPQAEDSIAAAPGVVKDSAADTGYDWLSLEKAEWLTDDTALKGNKTYYLSVILAAAGHRIPDSFPVTISGKAPIQTTIEYKDGKAMLTGIWQYSVGTPEKVTVSFDANGHGMAPDSVSVDSGTQLKYAGLDLSDQGIVKEENTSWRFDGWYGENGVLWDTLTADGDIVLHAEWTRLIDEISLTYEIPAVGDSGEDLLKVTAPEGAVYQIKNACVNEVSKYDTVTEISNTDLHELEFRVYPVSEEIDFKTEMNKWDTLEYIGSFTINGEEPDIFMYEEDEDGKPMIRVSYKFTPLEGGFVDVPSDSFYASAVDWAVRNEITNGVDKRHFAPKDTCTRAQMVTFLWRAFGKPECSETEHPFVDVENDKFYTEAVLWAVDQGLTRGTDETHFSPDATVTRGQSVTFLCRLMGSRVEEAVPFEDVKQDAFYYDAVCWAVAYGITNGKSDTIFDPEGECTRAEIVTFLYRAKGQEIH